jgi:hypothetical protein
MTAMSDPKMTDENDAPLPEALRRAILADLKPVKPLAPAHRRAILLVPWTLLALATFWSKFGFRPDLPRLGVVLAWGLSAAQLFLALVVAVGSLRESTPGSGLSRATLWACAVGAFGFHLAGLALAFRQSPFPTPPGLASFELRACLYYEFLIAVPLLLFGLWLLIRGLTLHPATAGALAGLAAGLLADSSWRLICPFTFPSHVLPSHTGPILGMAVLGAILGVLIDRSRLRRT